MAKVSIDEQIARQLPWTLVLTIDGEEYQTRPPTLGALATIERAGKEKSGVTLDELMEAASSMFHIIPPLHTWQIDKLRAVVGAVMEYAEGRGKNAKRAAAIVAPTPEATTSPSGS